MLGASFQKAWWEGAGGYHSWAGHGALSSPGAAGTRYSYSGGGFSSQVPGCRKGNVCLRGLCTRPYVRELVGFILPACTGDLSPTSAMVRPQGYTLLRI